MLINGGTDMIKSVRENFEHEIIINKSRFICVLVPLHSIEEVQEHLELYKEIYPEANHYCYAYIYDGSIKASDDGEPSKTAGMPMLNVLQKQELNHILAIVIRYFGGIKLGAGGLVRAYSQSVSQALLEAPMVTYELCPLYQITFDYSLLKIVDYQIRKFNIKVTNKAYDEKVRYTCFVKDVHFFDLLQEASSNQYEKEFIKNEYIEKEEKVDG